MPSNALSTMAPPEGPEPSGESGGGGRRPWSTRKRQVVVAGASLVVLALLVALLSGHGSLGSKGSGGSTKAGSSGAADLGASATNGAPGGGTAAGSGSSGKSGVRPNPNGLQITPGMPLTVSVSDTSHLKDGDSVSIHVVAKPGSAVYAFEARECATGVVYNDDALQRPSLGGHCAAQNLSADSQRYGEYLSDPPNKSVDGTYKVGVGSNSFTTQDGRAVTLTCGPGHPCLLVLKLQFPNGYGFEAIPLRFV